MSLTTLSFDAIIVGGGGAGLRAAIAAAEAAFPAWRDTPRSKLIGLSASGARFDGRVMATLLKRKELRPRTLEEALAGEKPFPQLCRGAGLCGPEREDTTLGTWPRARPRPEAHARPRGALPPRRGLLAPRRFKALRP